MPINTKAAPRAVAHKNFMDAPSYDLSPLAQLKAATASAFFGEPKYYLPGEKPVRGLTSRFESELLRSLAPQYKWDGYTPSQIIEISIDNALDYDPVATLRWASELRNVHYIRVTPQVILVRAANHKALKGTGVIPEYVSQIVTRLDDMTEGLAYQLGTFGKPIPNALKKGWARILAEAKPYQLAKYAEDGKAVKLRDVINVVTGQKYGALHSEPIVRFMKGELKNETTWEAVISAQGNNKAAWEEVLPHMGHMAILRNLRNMVDAGLDPSMLATKLVQGAPTGKQLPFRYFSAYKMVENGIIRDALEECLVISMENIPFFDGTSLNLTDNSGSARGAMTSSLGKVKVSDIGNLMAVLTAKRSTRGIVGVFGDRYVAHEVRKHTSIFDELTVVDRKGAHIGEGTEHGIWVALDKAISMHEHYDYIFCYSDMQAGHGGLYGNSGAYANYALAGSAYIDVPKLLLAYRRTVNPNVKVFLIQIAGYADTLVPEWYDKTWMLSGWSENVLKFAKEAIEIQQ